MDYFSQIMFRPSGEKPSCKKESGLCLQIACWREFASVWLDLIVCRCSSSMVEYFVLPALSIYELEEFRRAEYELAQQLTEPSPSPLKQSSVQPCLTTEWVMIRCRDLIANLCGTQGINLREMGKFCSVAFQLKDHGRQTQRLVISGLEENTHRAKKHFVKAVLKCYVQTASHKEECERQCPSSMLSDDIHQMGFERSDFYIPRELIGLLIDSSRKVLRALEDKHGCFFDSRQLSAENSDNIFLRVTAQQGSMNQVASSIHAILRFPIDSSDMFQLSHIHLDGCHFWILNHSLEKPVDTTAQHYYRAMVARITQGSRVVDDKRIQELQSLHSYLVELEQNEKPMPPPILPSLISLSQSQFNNYNNMMNGFTLSPRESLLIDSPKLDTNFQYGSTASHPQSIEPLPPNQDPFLNFAHTSDSSSEAPGLSPAASVEQFDTSCNSLKRTYHSSLSPD